MPHRLSHLFLQFSLLRQSIGTRKPVAVVTAFAFALLLFAALSHHHETALDVEDCFVCAVVMHKVGLNKTVVKLQQIVTIFLYQALTGFKACENVDKSICILPPSCGPPSFCSSP